MNIKKWMSHWLSQDKDRKLTVEYFEDKFYCILNYSKKEVLVSDESMEVAVIKAIKEYNLRQLDDRSKES